jgi:hypothetical protein
MMLVVMESPTQQQLKQQLDPSYVDLASARAQHGQQNAYIPAWWVG